MQVRFYAGAADAAGAPTADLPDHDLSAAELVDRLGLGNHALATVLARCSLLVDGAAVRDPAELIPGSARVDVLPPFAGG